jgi:hypothetical protein
MPHFAFWAWPLPFISSLPHASAAVSLIEADLPFREKDPRAVWRGTAWFNNGAGANPRLRQDLLKLAQNKSWADLQDLKWETNGKDAANALRIEDFCRYKYVIHTEGVSYSGRLQFLQMCASVLLSPPIEWMQHTTHFVKPVFSGSLLELDLHPNGVNDGDDVTIEPMDEAEHEHARRTRARQEHTRRQDTRRERKYPSYRMKEAWPVDYPPGEANAIFVNPDWSDLEAVVAWLERHPDVAEGIARRQRETFAGGGYLSAAAEACYWRSLIRGWSNVVRTDGLGWEEKQGQSFEEFVVRDERERR